MFSDSLLDHNIPLIHSRELQEWKNNVESCIHECRLDLSSMQHLQRLNRLLETTWRWKMALEGLTPGGSEFVDDPHACAQYVSNTQKSLFQRLRETKASHAIPVWNVELVRFEPFEANAGYYDLTVSDYIQAQPNEIDTYLVKRAEILAHNKTAIEIAESYYGSKPVVKPAQEIEHTVRIEIEGVLNTYGEPMKLWRISADQIKALSYETALLQLSK